MSVQGHTAAVQQRQRDPEQLLKEEQTNMLSAGDVNRKTAQTMHKDGAESTKALLGNGAHCPEPCKWLLLA
eukprot:scaffold51357_cov20-Tisochrysis_lutea.AAC.2